MSSDLFKEYMGELENIQTEMNEEKAVIDNMYLENLDEYVNDEEKIVTYKRLSLTLGVNTNIAKQMLYNFVTQQRNGDKTDRGNINIIYAVSGVVHENKEDVYKMFLVREENLEAVKSTMKKVISVHIYSVQKSRLKDLSALYSADYDCSKENLNLVNNYSSIACPSAKARLSAYVAQPQPEIPTKVSQEPIRTQESKKPSSVVSQKKSALAEFFNKGSLPAKHKTMESSVKTERGNKTHALSASVAIAQTKSEEMFSPSAESNASPSSKSETLDSATSTPKYASADSELFPAKKVKTQPKIKSKKCSSKKGRSEYNEESPFPKRKRILEPSDSDSSSDEENEDDKESPFPPSPYCESSVTSTSDDVHGASQPDFEEQQVCRGGRARKRKLISKTYEDEDGYM
ncbi:DNA polymerase delta subunit 3, partial [Halocaridina rubra]